ncbi:unnamed protein product [Moneuplotes crassus]|uniref:Uncharacterized protein n=1 Tax=Euplotes crassus TaxID=5936 RepID=A0AAD2CZX0_EUPCR|nr:unnamed protein product [Moneuplotes crassus]
MKSSKKNFMTEETPSGFKVPVARKRSAFQLVGPSAKNSSSVYRLQNKPSGFSRQRMRLLNLICKLVDDPSSLSKGDKITLMNHPIVKDLIRYSEINNCGPGNFYVPVESLVEAVFQDAPSCRDDTQPGVEVLFQKVQTEQKLSTLTRNNIENDVKVEENLNSQEPFPSRPEGLEKIGFYTRAERREKIQKYRKKVHKWLHKKKSRSYPTQNAGCLRKREKKDTSTSSKGVFPHDSSSTCLHTPSHGHLQQSCSEEFLGNFESEPTSLNLNDIVAQISGIN